MSHALIHTAQVPEVPWGKNYGQAKHFWSYPEGVADFRVYLGLASMEVSESIFTIFPKKNRLQFLLQGEIELSVDGEKQKLDSTNRSHRFSGEAHTTCTVVRAPVTVFNVICEPQINVSEPVFGSLSERTLSLRHNAVDVIDVIFNWKGNAHIRGNLNSAQNLLSGDALILDRKLSTSTVLQIEGDAQLLYLSLENF